ncbi:MAG: RidA family protein [Desulfobacteraceae bacterium]|nr:RidA family protein [Desulfobacteraceae bacterium]
MKLINVPKAPSAVGPYSHAVIQGDLIYCSGQIPLDPKTMEIIGKDIEAQTEQVMRNIESILKYVDSGLDKIVKATVFLANLDDFHGMNVIYEAALKGHKPARSTFQVAKLPKDALIEIECIAVKELGNN